MPESTSQTNWRFVKIEQLAAKTKNALAMGPFGSRITKDNFVETGVPIIRGINISNGRFYYQDFVFLTEEKANELKASNAFPDDLVFTHRGTLGQVGIIPKGFYPRYVVSQSQMKLTCDQKKVFPMFLYYYFRSELGLHELLSHTGGSGVPAISSPLTTLRNAAIYLPPLPTQHKIASTLSAYDDLIENNTRRITILEEMAQSLYREWFVHFRFPGYEKKRLLESELGLIPEGWGVVKASYAVEIDPLTKVPKEGDKPFVSMGGLSINSMLIENVETRIGNSGSKFRNGDTLFARITPCLENGKTGFVQFLPSASAVAFGSTEFIVLRSRTLCPEYVYLMARSNEFRDNAIKSMTGATGRQRVQTACFDKYLISQPDSNTLAAFEETVSPIFRNIHVLARKSANLRQTRDLLLPKLISGEVEVEGLSIKVGK